MNPFPDASYATTIPAPPACSPRPFKSSIIFRRPARLAENVVLSDFSRLWAIRVTRVLSCESHPTNIKLLFKASSPSWVIGLRMISWSKLSFYQTRTGTRFVFLHDELLGEEGKSSPHYLSLVIRHHNCEHHYLGGE